MNNIVNTEQGNNIVNREQGNNFWENLSNYSPYIFLATLVVAFLIYVLVITLGTGFDLNTLKYQINKLFEIISGGFKNTSNLYLYFPIIIFILIIIIYKLIINHNTFLTYGENTFGIIWNIILGIFKQINSAKFWILLFIVLSLLISVFYWWLRIKYNFFGTHDNDFRECTKEIREIIYTRKQKPLINQDGHDGENIKNYKIKDFYVFTSHNTYCPCLQNLDISHKDMYIVAIKLGCRVIEFDMYQRNNIKKDLRSKEPVIAHGKSNKSGDLFTTTLLDFGDTIKKLSAHAFINTNDPIILDLECNFHGNTITANKIADIIENHFGKRVYWGNNKYIGDKPIKEFLGKVIVRTGSGVPRSSKLNKMRIKFLKNLPSDMSSRSLSRLQNQAERGLVRIYPAGNLSGGMSNNYDPKKFWEYGAQLVACNISTLDDNLRKQLKMFENYSFKLKPKHLI